MLEWKRDYERFWAWYQSLKKKWWGGKEEYDPTREAHSLWTIAIYGFEHQLFDENGQRRSSPTGTYPTGYLSLSLSPIHSLNPTTTTTILFFSLPWYSIFLSWVLLLSMDRNDKQQIQLQHQQRQQQQLSLAKCARQPCNEWFVLFFFSKFECSLQFIIFLSILHMRFSPYII